MFDFFVDAVSAVGDFFLDDIPSYIMQGAEWFDDTILGYGNDITTGTLYKSGPFPGINQTAAGSFFTTVKDYGPLEKAADYLFGMEGGPYTSSFLGDLGKEGIGEIAGLISGGGGGAQAMRGTTRAPSLNVSLPSGKSGRPSLGSAGSALPGMGDARFQANLADLYKNTQNRDVQNIFSEAYFKRNLSGGERSLALGSAMPSKSLRG